jgi:hypothetical protein
MSIRLSCTRSFMQGFGGPLSSQTLNIIVSIATYFIGWERHATNMSSCFFDVDPHPHLGSTDLSVKDIQFFELD